MYLKFRSVANTFWTRTLKSCHSGYAQHKLNIPTYIKIMTKGLWVCTDCYLPLARPKINHTSSRTLLNPDWDFLHLFVSFSHLSLDILKYFVAFFENLNFIAICNLLDVQYTNNGEECKNKCQKDGESYNWCWKVSGSWDYCTPSVLGKKWKNFAFLGFEHKKKALIHSRYILHKSHKCKMFVIFHLKFRGYFTFINKTTWLEIE